MKRFLKVLVVALLLIFAGSSLANNPPDGVSSQQWGKIKQQIMASKYYPQADNGGLYTAQNKAQGWQVSYAPNGMTTINNNDYYIGMKLQSIGAQRIDSKPNIEVKENTLYYHHSPQIKEWWVNSADKVEQWFSIKKRPITGDQKLKVQISIDTDTTVSQSGDQLTFTTQKGQSINYNKLKVWDSRGTILASRMQLAVNKESFALIVNDSQAKYPITIDPSFNQTHYIKPLVTDETDWFGNSVDIDGDVMVVGVPNEDSASTLINGDSSDNSADFAGVAYIFVRSGADWVQQAYLKASNTDASDQFGNSVAVSGTTVVVGAHGEAGDADSTMDSPNNNSNFSGAAYVFTRSGATWSQQAYLKPFNVGSGDYFGTSVAIDGNIIVVGSPSDDGDADSTMDLPNENANAAGAAHVFSRLGTTWTQEDYLKASNAEENDNLGNSVAIDGGTVVVSANNEDGDANSDINTSNNAASDAGAAYVFRHSGSTWSQQAYLKAHNAEAEDEFSNGYGRSVTIDGETIVVGARYEDGDDSSSMDFPNNNATDAGAAYVFVRNETTWSQQAYLKASNAEAGDSFAASVAIAGETIVVGADREAGDANSSMELPNNNSLLSGAAYVFARNGSEWEQKNYLKSDNLGSFDFFGKAVAIDDGNIIITATGENGDASSTMEFPNENTNSAGAVYLFKGEYFIGVSVGGLTSAGLVLQNNGGDDLSITENGNTPFNTQLNNGSSFNVTILSQPNDPNNTCQIIGTNSGTIAAGNVLLPLICGNDIIFVNGFE